MMKSDRWTGLVVLLFSLYVCLESGRLGFGAYSRPGPGFFPFYSGLLLAAFSLVLIPIGFLARQEKEAPWDNSLNIFMVGLSMFAFAWLLEPLGFVATAFLFTVFLFKAVERRGWIFSLAAALLIAGSSYVVFDRWLQAQLPAGVLGK